MKNKLPFHVAIIMDGNGRWARERGLPRIIGHKVGAESVREIIRTAKDIGIKYLTLFTFSTENWRRPEEEVNFLMDMLKQLLRDEVEDLKRNGVRLRAMGRLDMLPRRVKEELEYAERETEMNKDLTVILALSYSGRAEIVDAVKKMVRKAPNPEHVTEDTFRNFLYLPDVPEPDLMIRTSGEMRISNFMLWQLAYTELYFTKTLWPDFRREEFLKIIEDYTKRERRFGGIPT